jgi:endonuclease YncB( thermonuclease family)
MSSLRLGSTTWLMRPPRTLMLRPAVSPARRPGLAILCRTLGLMAATAAFGFTTLASEPRANQSLVDHVSPDRRAAYRPLSAHTDVVEALSRPNAGSTPSDVNSELGLFQARALVSGSTFRAAGPNSSFNGFGAPAAPNAEWREEEFDNVRAVDGRTLAVGGLRIHLVGLDLPMPEQVCRTLDGRLEYCTARAATQLELLTRWKQVTCHYRLERAGEAIGRCRIGTSDLSERMIKSGYAWGSVGGQARG